jgi:hypothetical protein
MTTTYGTWRTPEALRVAEDCALLSDNARLHHPSAAECDRWG